MPTYKVIVVERVSKEYVVEADNEFQAKEKVWVDDPEPVSVEPLDSEVHVFQVQPKGAAE